MLEPHLDAEQLSAAVDGDADEGVRDHLDACAACRRQLDTWKETLGTLASAARADRLDPGIAEGILGAALAAAGGDPPAGADGPRPAVIETGGDRPGGVEAPAVRRVTPMPPAPERTHPSGGSLRRWRKPIVSTAVGVAAAGLIALAVVGLRPSGGTSSASSAAGSVGASGSASNSPSAAAPASGGAGSGTAGATGSATAGGTSAGRATAAPLRDLGQVGDQKALVGVLRASLGAHPSPASQASAEHTGSRAALQAVPSPVAACLAAAKSGAGPAAGPPREAAELRYRGRAAEVYVFADGGAWRALVLARSCAPLGAVRF